MNIGELWTQQLPRAYRNKLLGVRIDWVENDKSCNGTV